MSPLLSDEAPPPPRWRRWLGRLFGPRPSAPPPSPRLLLPREAALPPPAPVPVPPPLPPVAFVPPAVETPSPAPSPSTRPARPARPRPQPRPQPRPGSSAPLRQQEDLPLALALQGGGAHGAFTWGVLDRLLEDPALRFDSLSGTSAGAMNAVIVAYGLIDGGRPQARALLAAFWQKIAQAGALTPFRRSWIDRLDGGWSLDNSPWLALMDVARQFVSPYQTNPLGLNPLRETLLSLVDFDALRQQDQIKLHIAATNVHTGTASVFSTPEIDVQHVMASACLPFLFQAVEIDGIPHWDGGYVSNPPLSPLIRHSNTRDLLLVPINPPRRDGTPRTARDIFNRLNEITFNASLQHELHSLQQINSLIDGGLLKEGPYRRMRLHRIDADAEFHQLSASSKINTEWEFLCYLHDLGYQSAEGWLAAHRADLGRQDSLQAAHLA
ncbi:patatin-like phospholipase family protein [Insolitispirillum peregrinum]|uniref:patatin-like phospholipase family protein n=1 Tax=Insolitispirillum peregrinum TaxID=80876 RepID=UPI0036147E95